MESTQVIKIIRRTTLRNSTEAVVTCRPYVSYGAVHIVDGVMRNFSSRGSYIETGCRFKSGTILIVRMIRYPLPSPAVSLTRQPRSICLAEVRWSRKLADHHAIRYGMGLRYLD